MAHHPSCGAGSTSPPHNAQTQRHALDFILNTAIDPPTALPSHTRSSRHVQQAAPHWRPSHELPSQCSILSSDACEVRPTAAHKTIRQRCRAPTQQRGQHQHHIPERHTDENPSQPSHLLLRHDSNERSPLLSLGIRTAKPERHLHERYPENEHHPDPCIQHAVFPTNIQHNIQQSARPEQRIQRGMNSPQDLRSDRVRRVGDSQLPLHGIKKQKQLHNPQSFHRKHEQREYQQQNQHPHDPPQDQLPPHPQRDQQQNQDPDQPSSPAHLHPHPYPQQQSQQQQQPPQRPTKKKKKPKPPMSYEEKRKARKCTVVDCQNYTINKGRCFRHGGGKQCTMDGCQASAKVAGLCWKHGGSVPCVIDGCERRGKSRGLCWAHGGGSKCQAHACSKVAVSNGFCWAHGGGKRCVYDGCRRPGYERTFNFCTRHYELLQGGEHTVEV